MKKLLGVSLVSGVMVMGAFLHVQAEETTSVDAVPTVTSEVEVKAELYNTSSSTGEVKPTISRDEMKINYETLKLQKEEMMQKMEEEIRLKKEIMQKQIQENQMKMKENIQNFQGEKKSLQLGKKLTEEQHSQIEEIRKMWKTEVDTLVATLKGLDDAEKRKAIVDQVTELNKAYAEKIKAIVGEVSDAAVEMVDKRMEIMNTNHVMRKDNIDMRYEFRAERKDMVNKYKATFKFKLKAKLDNVPAEKLEKILAKVVVMEETITNNSNLSETSKEKMLSQISALKEIFEEKIEEYSLKNDEMIDLDALFE